MPPNNDSSSILGQFKYNYKQVANPYSEKKHTCYEECSESSESEGSRDHEAPEELVDDTYRVTTQARQTYELYNYSKNAMMIVTSESDGDVHSGLVNKLTRTFQKFRFEVDLSVASSEGELYTLCEQFFQRDFTDYGAVALVIMTPMGVNRQRSGSGPLYENSFFYESVISENFKVDRNVTLANKPKIYISEANRGFFRPLNDDLEVLDPVTHGDVVGFQLPGSLDKIIARMCIEPKFDTEDNWAEDGNEKSVFYMPRVLKIFCDKLAAMGDTKNFVEIIGQIVENAGHDCPLSNPQTCFNNAPIQVINTLSKELYFSRIEENQ